MNTEQDVNPPPKKRGRPPKNRTTMNLDDYVEGTGHIGEQMMYRRRLKCHSMIYYDGDGRFNMTKDKILLPISVLEAISSMDIENPYIFEISKVGMEGIRTYCGVQEFVYTGGEHMFIPPNIMEKLYLEEGENVDIKSIKMKKIEFLKLKPMSMDFLEIEEPKVILEEAFKNYTCITEGDMINFEYGGIPMQVEVTEVRPDGRAMVLLDTECEVDFEPPVGYEEHIRKVKEEQEMIMKKIEEEEKMKSLGPREVQRAVVKEEEVKAPSVFSRLQQIQQQSTTPQRKSIVDTSKFSQTKNFSAFSGKGNRM